MDYSVTCSCGMWITVDATQAGSEVACECGQQVLVPPLSRLRLASGEGAYLVGMPGKIRRMISTGELPWGDTCAYSGRPTNDTIDFMIECERSYSGSPDRGSGALSVFLSGFAAAMFGVFSMEEPEDIVEIHGREVLLQVPLRVSSDWHDKVLRIKSRRQLREMLRTVPVYAELLDEYPLAEISVVREGDDLSGY